MVTNKKAQLKIQQMAFMIIAVTILFALIALFVISFKFSDLKRDALEIKEENSLKLVARLANSPEFSCGTSFGTKRGNCVDANKVMALKESVEGYNGFWGRGTNIKIDIIYPVKEKSECFPNTFPNCNTINVTRTQGGIYQSNFVNLCRKEEVNGEMQEVCDLAKILVSYEE